MQLDPQRNLPELVNVSVAPPPRPAPEAPRKLDPDDLPILTRQTAEERQLAARMGVRIPASIDGSVREGDGRIIGRAYATVRGRPLALKSGLLAAHVLVLTAEA